MSSQEIFNSHSDKVESEFQKRETLNKALNHLIESKNCDDLHKKEFENLLSHGAEVNCENGDIKLPLLVAVLHRKGDWVQFLLDVGADPDLEVETSEDGFTLTVTDVAWREKAFDIFLQLVVTDSAFPSDYVEDELSESERIEFDKFIESRNQLHTQIANGNLSAVEQFVRENPKIKFAYDFDIKSALSTALESKSFEVYSFLRSEGFSNGLDSFFDDILKNLSEDDRNELKFTNRKYFHSNEVEHIMELLSKSRLGFGSNQSNFKKIQKWYEMLDEIPETRAILKIIANAKKIDIVFDFNRGTVCDMDPTQMKHIVRGRTIYTAGNIRIGAKRNDEAEI